MIPVTIDFETYWDASHSLSKMSPILYCLHPGTELQSVAFKIGEKPTECILGEADIQAWADSVDWSDVLVIGHNMSAFDAMLLAWRLGVKPKQWGCTLAMARPIHGKDVGGSLAALVKHYGLGVKDQAIIHQTKGRRLVDFTAQELLNTARYNKEDVNQTWRLFKTLLPRTSKEEMALIDLTTRMLVYPQFDVDLSLLKRGLTAERTRKRRTLLALGQTLGVTGLDDDAVADQVSTILMSAPKFSALLAEQGVAVPTKISPTTGKEAPALAKTDQAFLDLQEHDNPIVAAAAMARLGIRSTILETRIEAFIETANACAGKLPVPLRYWGAATGRWSGEIYNCFTGETEILTRYGWRRFDTWQGEAIMQWWPYGELSFEDHPGVLVKHYSGKVVDIESVCASAAVTPDHRLVAYNPAGVTKRTPAGVKERTASWVAAHRRLDGIPACGVWGGAATSISPELVRLAVAFTADGHFSKGSILVGLRRRRKIARMAELLDAAQVPYRVREYPPQAGHKGTHNTITYVIPNPPIGKGFGPWILGLSREALTAFVEELRYWDGQSHHKNGNICFWTTKLDEAGWVQTAFALSGIVSTVRRYPQADPKHLDSILVYARSEKGTSIATSRDISIRDFSGLVYCASVASSYILVRRNNKISVMGQCQNLPRVNPSKPAISDVLRLSLQAPPGNQVVVVDLSGIELRMNHFLWQVPSSMALFQASPDKADLYKDFASTLYDVPREGVNKTQRTVGKVAHLGLGYGSGPGTFRKVAKVMGGVELSDGEAASIVAKWREEYQPIVNGWAACQGAVWAMASGRGMPIDPWGLCRTGKECIHLPKGTLRYPNLRQEWSDKTQRQEWVYGTGRNKSKIYGGLVVENLCQALGRTVMTDAILAFAKTPLGQKYPLAHCVHDEVVYVVRDEDAEAVLAAVSELMRTPPSWFPALITWSEGSYARRYGLAK
jgi:DNA polymerase family A